MAALLCTAALLVLGGCGRQQAAVTWTTLEPSAVTGVRLGGDGRTLAIDTQVPNGPRPCVRGLKALLTDSMTDLARVQVTFSSPSLDRASGCTKEATATVKVRLPEPLGDRDVVVDQDTRFTAHGAKLPALRLCGRLGCTPPATGCSTASYDQALMAVGAPEHTYLDSARCDGKWLVLDFSWRTGPACGDSTSPACSSRLGDRWFFRARTSGWVPLLRTSAGGCQDVHRLEPAFPTSLCASLAPLSASLHPSYPPPSASPAPGALPTASPHP